MLGDFNVGAAFQFAEEYALRNESDEAFRDSIRERLGKSE